MKHVAIIFCALFLVFSVRAVAPSALLNEGKVIYELPYPGITPENPLYIFKQIRDRVQEFLIRDNLSKAEYLLTSSDKRAHIALILTEKGKTRQAVEVLIDAEQKALSIPPLLRRSKEQGVAAGESFIYTLKLSNAKHKEIIGELVKLIPQGQDADVLNAILELNQRVATELTHL